MGLNVDELSAFLTGGEYYNAINKSEESVVFTHAYVQTGMMLSTTLTLDDVACLAVRTPKDLDAEAFAL